jgi:hypothetical protein
MPFTVVHKGGMNPEEYRSYLVLLSRRLRGGGIAVDRVPRVRAEDDGQPWLYAWDNEEEAAAFAKDLKRETRDSHWHVQPVKGKPSVGPLHPLEVQITVRGDGWTFGLDPLTELALQERFPGSCPYLSMGIRTERPNDRLPPREELRNLATQALFILTGLKAEQLRAFEKYRVIRSVTGEELIPPCPIP